MYLLTLETTNNFKIEDLCPSHSIFNNNNYFLKWKYKNEAHLRHNPIWAVPFFVFKHYIWIVILYKFFEALVVSCDPPFRHTARPKGVLWYIGHVLIMNKRRAFIAPPQPAARPPSRIALQGGAGQ